MKALRCSYLPRFLKCPQSMAAPEINMENVSGPEARTGTATHEIMAKIVAENLTAVPDCGEVAEWHDVDAEEVKRLAQSGMAIWRQLAGHISEVEVEKGGSCKRDTWLLTGTTDLCGRMGDELVVLDWKTGYIESDYKDQLLGYALLQTDGQPSSGKLVIGWLRYGTYEVVDYSGADIVDLETRIGMSVDSDKYSAGDHCTYCPRALECPVKRAQSANAVALFGDATTDLTPSSMAALYPKAQQLEKVLAQYKDAFKSMLANGPVEIDGKVYSLERCKRETFTGVGVRALEELGVELREYLDDLTISSEVIEKLCKSHCAPGRYRAWTGEVKAKMREVGGVKVSEYDKISIKKAEAKKEKKDA